MTPLLPDAAIRQRIETDLHTTLLVEAAAGTGKTHSLVTRMVALIRTGTCRVESMAAITFTKKAAAELRGRFQIGLESAARNAETNPESHARIREALDHLDRATIGTIHSFCAVMLRERPVEAGVAPGFREIEQDESKGLALGCWEDHVQRLHHADDPIVQELARAGLDFVDLRDAFMAMCEYLDVEFVTRETPYVTLRDTFESVRPFIEMAMAARPESAGANGRDDLQRDLPALAGMAARIDSNDDAAIAKLLINLYKVRSVTQNRWPDRAVAKKLSDEWKHLRKDVVGPAISAWQGWVHATTIRAIGSAPAEAQRRRILSGRLSFQDLLLLARDLLRDHPFVRRYFRSRFTHVLVDEFQDTDPVQTELLFYLTGIDEKERDWRKLVPRPGSLFIVGDPKQSIYRFRRADIALYQMVVRRIEETGGDVLRLSTNFRSVPALCNWFNSTFAEKFLAVASDTQAARVDMIAHRSEAVGGPLRLATPQMSSWWNPQKEAETISTWIDDAVRGGMVLHDGKELRPVQWRDFLLIARDRKNLGIYANALEARGVPYEVTGGRGFERSEELAMLRPMLRAAVDPDDQVAVAAFLRGPLCGADDDALFQYRSAGGRFRFLVREIEGIDERIGRGLSHLHDAWRDIRSLPPAAALSRIIDRAGILPLAAHGSQGATRAGVLLKTLALARAQSARGASFAEILRLLETHLDEGSDIEELSADPARENVVRLMNLHQAKGLEALVVFLIDPKKAPWSREPKMHVDRSTYPPQAHFIVHGRSTSNFGSGPILGVPQDWDAMAEREKEFEKAEESRLLYVAATRARNLLVVGQAMKPDGTLEHNSIWSPLSDAVTMPFDSLDVDLPEPHPIEIDLITERREIADDLTARRATALTPSWAEASVTGLAHSGAIRRTTKSKTDATPAQGNQVIDAGVQLVLPFMAGGVSESGLAGDAGVVPAESAESEVDPRVRGIVLHRLLEAAMTGHGDDLLALAKNLLVEENQSPDEAEAFVHLVDEIRASTLWRRAMTAKRRYVEVPFALSVPSIELGATEGPATTLLRGAIDLVFEEDGTWILVDYKSDSTFDGVDRLVERYRPQVELYAKYWAQQTGANVVAGLWFIDRGTAVWL